MIPLDDIYAFSAANEIDAACETIIERFETEFDAKRWNEVDEVFSYVDLDRLQPAIAIGLLRFSYAARNYLHRRPKYANRLLFWLQSNDVQLDISSLI